jgi:hypothetical protein
MLRGTSKDLYLRQLWRTGAIGYCTLTTSGMNNYLSEDISLSPLIAFAAGDHPAALRGTIGSIEFLGKLWACPDREAISAGRDKVSFSIS